jgi:hypothetical protein
MKDVSANIRKCLEKRQEALGRFQSRKAAFLLAKEQIIKEIGEARIIWKHTLDQLPGSGFNL